ncbi:MAG: putative metal-dependent hydrolase [Gemmatimonadaceae bacterium]|nr:putative metal-dependent hydrolase [Gemmatimonadaceae bacterium]
MTTTSDPKVEALRFPIGRFTVPESITPADRARYIEEIAAAPAALRAAVKGLSEKQLNTPYRPGGWTIRQVVHHLPDSHLNAYVRMKLALTEDEPVITPYNEDSWAKLPDSAQVPAETSLVLLEAVQERWVAIMRSMTEAQWHRVYVHPEMGRYPLDRQAALYAWHGKHHVAHIVRAT